MEESTINLLNNHWIIAFGLPSSFVTMKFFSKITFICNLGFLVFIVMGYIELNGKKGGINDVILPLPFIAGTLVVLGQFALFLNFFFCLFAALFFLSKKLPPIARWLLIVNFIFLLTQVYYFLIY